MSNDHTEYEGRVLNIDKEAVWRKLADCGAELVAKKNYRRYVFNTIPAVKNRWVRLRTDGQKTKLTVKEITKATVDGVQEWETVVDDFETTLAMLKKMGLKPKGYQENRRELYTLDGVKLSIDEWPGASTTTSIQNFQDLFPMQIIFHNNEFCPLYPKRPVRCFPQYEVKY